MNIDSSNLLYISTVQGHLFKKIFEILSTIINIKSCKIIIYNNEIRIKEYNTTNKLQVKLTIYGDKLEHFKYNREDCNVDGQLILTVNIDEINRYTKTIKNNDAFSIIVKKDNPQELILQKDDKDINSTSRYYIKMFNNINENKYDDVDEVLSYSNQYKLQTSIFLKIIKDFQLICKKKKDNLEIIGYDKYNKSFLQFKGEFGINKAHIFSSNIEISDNINCLENNSNSNVITSTFNIEYLLIIIKAASLNKLLTLYLEDNYPLTVQYDIGDIGYMRFILLNNSKSDANT